MDGSIEGWVKKKTHFPVQTLLSAINIAGFISISQPSAGQADKRFAGKSFTDTVE